MNGQYAYEIQLQHHARPVNPDFVFGVFFVAAMLGVMVWWLHHIAQPKRKTSTAEQHDADWYAVEEKRLEAKIKYDLKKREHDDTQRLFDDMTRGR